MEQIIKFETLRQFAYVNDTICKKPIKGIVLSFTGLGTALMYGKDTEQGIYYADKGILYVIPYYNPWSWMNRQACNYTDEILDVLFDAYDLPASTPIVSTGGSMGGLSALTYMAYAKRTPVACVTNCPVCDAVYHFTERPDLPRTMYSALYHEQTDLDTALRSISPLHLVEKMPKVKYHILHCDADKSVNLEKHSARLVEAMKEVDFDITFDIVPNRGHCDLPQDKALFYLRCAADAIEKSR